MNRTSSIPAVGTAILFIFLLAACQQEETRAILTVPPGTLTAPAFTSQQGSTPTIEPGQTPGGIVTCGNMQVSIPAWMGRFRCELLPESKPESGLLGNIFPEHYEILFLDHPEESWHLARIMVYPLASYALLVPDRINDKTLQMSAVLADPTGDGPIPILPMFNAMKIFTLHRNHLENGSIRGLRFLTMYTQWTPPVNNEEIFYTFQGLSADGQFWISVMFPVTHEMLPPDDTIPGGDPRAWADGWRAYLDVLQPQLEAQPDVSFHPSLLDLDEVVLSIQVLP